MSKPNYRQIYAIQKKNEERLLKLNPDLPERSGIYFWTRTDELSVRHGYVGLAHNLRERNTQHLSGKTQYIDRSIYKHGLYDEEKNPYGWKLNFLEFPESELEEKERYYITLYAKNGFQMKNRDTGGGIGKQELGERKAPKGYHDGLRQGRKNAIKEIADIVSKHLIVTLKPEKVNNKVSQKQFAKFKEILGLEDNNGTENQ